jgi:CRISPR/Cas system-associated protein Cas10 (large subunit of type III CRISPR-Cas system)
MSIDFHQVNQPSKWAGNGLANAKWEAEHNVKLCKEMFEKHGEVIPFADSVTVDNGKEKGLVSLTVNEKGISYSSIKTSPKMEQIREAYLFIREGDKRRVEKTEKYDFIEKNEKLVELPRMEKCESSKDPFVVKNPDPFYTSMSLEEAQKMTAPKGADAKAYKKA